MIREDRYLVLKWDRIHAAFEGEPSWKWDDFCAGLETIYFYLNSIDSHRKYVVVQDNWPEYEQVWSMLEKRTDAN